MSSARMFNGVDGRTGRFLSAPETEQEFARRIRGKLLSPEQLLDYKWWVKGFGINDPKRAPAQDVDPLKLSSAGWGVIFAPSIPSDIEDALWPLLKRREQAAGVHFRNYRPTSKETATKEDFLEANNAGAGPANPKDGKVPYYLLIVGSAEEISFSFQYELDVQYAVGRIHFTDREGKEDKAAYEAYAKNVVETEEAAETGAATLPPKEVTFFGVSQQGDPATERAAKDLIQPLAKTLAADRTDWPPKLFVGPQAKKEQLSRLLGGGQTPSVLLTASHGVSFPYEDELQRSCQGALLCQDWPGKDRDVLPEHYFAGTDLAPEADLRGLISFHFGCFSGGTPDVSSFFDSSLSRPQPVAPVPFVSNLAQRLLGHPQGALAVVGHVDRAWSTSFSWSDPSQIDLFENTLKRLFDGHPIGSAMEYFNQRHAELAVAFGELCRARERLVEVDDERFARTFRAYSDVQNFIVLGDPAVKAVFRAPV